MPISQKHLIIKKAFYKERGIFFKTIQCCWHKALNKSDNLVNSLPQHFISNLRLHVKLTNHGSGCSIHNCVKWTNTNKEYMDAFGTEGACGPLALMFCIRKIVEHCHHPQLSTTQGQPASLYVMCKLNTQQEASYCIFKVKEGIGLSQRRKVFFFFVGIVVLHCSWDYGRGHDQDYSPLTVPPPWHRQTNKNIQ